jgi:hypothetical protein
VDVVDVRPSLEAGKEGALAEIAAGVGTDWPTYTREAPGMSAFALEDGVVYHTYSAYARGVDGLWGMYQWLDRAPLGETRAASGSAATTSTTAREGNTVCAGGRDRFRTCGLCRVKGARPPHVPSTALAWHHIVAAQPPSKLGPIGAARGVARHGLWQVAGMPGPARSRRDTEPGRARHRDLNRASVSGLTRCRPAFVQHAVVDRGLDPAPSPGRAA